MDVSPDTQRLVGTLFLVFNASGIFLYGAQPARAALAV
jgi:hypothetical protein